MRLPLEENRGNPFLKYSGKQLNAEPLHAAREKREKRSDDADKWRRGVWLNNRRQVRKGACPGSCYTLTTHTHTH